MSNQNLDLSSLGFFACETQVGVNVLNEIMAAEGMTPAARINGIPYLSRDQAERLREIIVAARQEREVAR